MIKLMKMLGTCTSLHFQEGASVYANAWVIPITHDGIIPEDTSKHYRQSKSIIFPFFSISRFFILQLGAHVCQVYNYGICRV